LEKDTKNPKKKHQEIQRLISTITQNQSETIKTRKKMMNTKSSKIVLPKKKRRYPKKI